MKEVPFSFLYPEVNPIYSNSLPLLTILTGLNGQWYQIKTWILIQTFTLVYIYGLLLFVYLKKIYIYFCVDIRPKIMQYEGCKLNVSFQLFVRDGVTGLGFNELKAIIYKRQKVRLQNPYKDICPGKLTFDMQKMWKQQKLLPICKKKEKRHICLLSYKVNINTPFIPLMFG